VLPRDTITAINIHGNVCSADAYQYGYNGQIKDNEWAGLGNHYQFKAREFDPRICRFWSIDPLFAKFPWNGQYNFAENRPIDGADFEGKEWSSSTTGNTTRNHLTITVINASKIIRTQNDVDGIVGKMLSSFNESYTKDVGDHTYVATSSEQAANYENLTRGPTINVKLVDLVSDFSQNGEGTFKAGETYIGETQSNLIEVGITLNGKQQDQGDINYTFNHEVGHTAGLQHPWESKLSDISQPGDVSKLTPQQRKDIKSNLMNSQENPTRSLRNSNGSNITPGQIKKVTETIENQQPSKK
jgi:RHS repeat-associated protein